MLARALWRLVTRMERLLKWIHLLHLGWKALFSLGLALVIGGVTMGRRFAELGPVAEGVLDRLQGVLPGGPWGSAVVFVLALCLIVFVLYELGRSLVVVASMGTRTWKFLMWLLRRFFKVNPNAQHLPKDFCKIYFEYFSQVARDMHASNLLPTELRESWEAERLHDHSSVDPGLLHSARCKIHEDIRAGSAREGHEPIFEFRDWYWRRYLMDGDDHCRPVLVRGEPGSGKSIQLYHLFGDEALRFHKCHEGWVPLLILAHNLNLQQLNQAATMEALLRSYFATKQRQAESGGTNVEAAAYAAAQAIIEIGWSECQFLVIIDGLDEMQDQREHDRMLKRVGELIERDGGKRTKKHRYLLSCREDEDSPELKSDRVVLLRVSWEEQRSHFKRQQRMIEKGLLPESFMDGDQPVDRKAQLKLLLKHMEQAEYHQLFRNYLSNPFFLYIITSCYRVTPFNQSNTLRNLFEESLKRELRKDTPGRRAAETQGTPEAQVFAMMQDLLGPFCFWRSFVVEEDSRTLDPDLQFSLFMSGMRGGLGVGRLRPGLMRYFQGGTDEQEKCVSEISVALAPWGGTEVGEFISRLRSTLKKHQGGKFDEFESAFMWHYWRRAVLEFERWNLGTVTSWAISKFRHRRMVELLATISLEKNLSVLKGLEDRIESIWLREPLRMIGALCNTPVPFMEVFLKRWAAIKADPARETERTDLMCNTSEFITYLPRPAKAGAASLENKMIAAHVAALGREAAGFARHGGIGEGKEEAGNLHERIEFVSMIYGCEFLAGLGTELRRSVCGSDPDTFARSLWGFAMLRPWGPWEKAFRCLWSMRRVHPEIKLRSSQVYLVALRELLFASQFQYLVRETHERTFLARLLVGAIWLVGVGGGFATAWMLWPYVQSASASSYAGIVVGLFLFLGFSAYYAQNKGWMDPEESIFKFKLPSWLACFLWQIIRRTVLRRLLRHPRPRELPGATSKPEPEPPPLPPRPPRPPLPWKEFGMGLLKVGGALLIVSGIWKMGSWAHESYSPAVRAKLDTWAAESALEDIQAQQDHISEFEKKLSGARLREDEAALRELAAEAASLAKGVEDLQGDLPKKDTDAVAGHLREGLKSGTASLRASGENLRRLSFSLPVETDAISRKKEGERLRQLALAAMRQAIAECSRVPDQPPSAATLDELEKILDDYGSRLESGGSNVMVGSDKEAEEIREAWKVQESRIWTVKVRATEAFGRLLIARESGVGDDAARESLLSHVNDWMNLARRVRKPSMGAPGVLASLDTTIEQAAQTAARLNAFLEPMRKRRAGDGLITSADYSLESGRKIQARLARGPVSPADGMADDLSDAASWLEGSKTLLYNLASTAADSIGEGQKAVLDGKAAELTGLRGDVQTLSAKRKLEEAERLHKEALAAAQQVLEQGRKIQAEPPPPDSVHPLRNRMERFSEWKKSAVAQRKALPVLAAEGDGQVASLTRSLDELITAFSAEIVRLGDRIGELNADEERMKKAAHRIGILKSKAVDVLNHPHWPDIQRAAGRLGQDFAGQSEVIQAIKRQPQPAASGIKPGVIEDWIEQTRLLEKTSAEAGTALSRLDDYERDINLALVPLKAENSPLLMADIAALNSRQSETEEARQRLRSVTQWVEGAGIKALQDSLAAELQEATRLAQAKTDAVLKRAAPVLGLIIAIGFILFGSNWYYKWKVQRAADASPARDAMITLLKMRLPNKAASLAFSIYAEREQADRDRKGGATMDDIVAELTSLKGAIRGYGHNSRTLEDKIDNYLGLLENQQSRVAVGSGPAKT